MKDKNHWKMFDEYVLGFALEQSTEATRVAIVTLVEVDGSSPWLPVAQMAVTETGQWAGYLSGGCIERAVVGEVEAAFKEGCSRRVRYGRGSRYMDVQLPCGSVIELVVDIGVTRAALETVDSEVRARRRTVLYVPDAGGPLLKGGARGPFLRTYLPRRRVLVAGIGPVASQLAGLAKAAGFEVAVASPDERTRDAADAIGARSFAILPSTDGRSFDLDARTAVVLAFHDHEWEANVLPIILNSDAFYIGAMGSSATHRQRLERVSRQGFETATLTRIHGPAGVLAHARGAIDISVSILAEIVNIEAETVREVGLLAAAARQAA